jgi:site-specific DNA-methyltransferase (adenine-specific)
MQITDKIIITNEDCMDLLKRTPDNFYELAICDPPYGIGVNKGGHSLAGNGNFKGGNFKVKSKKYLGGEWDNKRPSFEYFNELKRVSKNQIIWGGNYFADLLNPSSCWLVWDKDNGESYQADCELAWSSFKTSVRKYSFRWWGLLQGDMKNKEIRIHPTQKPKQLYKWILDNYAKEGDKILDTHLGSGSIAIACHDYKFDLTACELNKEYYDAAVKRITNHVGQTKLF